MEARIHSFQSFSADDGPGIRCVVFFQGCPLRCLYCHNADTWEFEGGSTYDMETIFNKILRCKPYFGSTGGVTLSGGEVLYQAKFAAELFRRCKEANINTCIETSGSILNEDVIELIRLTDLVYLDVKMTTEEDYQKHVGTSLTKVMRFLDVLEQEHKQVIVRQVILEGLNDNKKSVLRLKALLGGYAAVERIEFLPFHKLGSQKYAQLGLVDRSAAYPATSLETIDRCYEYYYGKRHLELHVEKDQQVVLV